MIHYELDNVFRLKTEVNNSLISHRTNNFRALRISKPTNVLQRYRNTLKAIVYCPRNGALKIFGLLKQTDVLIIQVLIDLVSTRKRKDPHLVKDYCHLL